MYIFVFLFKAERRKVALASVCLCWASSAVILPQKEDVGLSVLLVARGVHDKVEAESGKQLRIRQ